MCEISTEEHPVPCVWALIIERLTKLGKLDQLAKVQPPKDWSTSYHGGPRSRVREDLRIAQEKVESEA